MGRGNVARDNCLDAALDAGRGFAALRNLVAAPSFGAAALRDYRLDPGDPCSSSS